MEGGLFWFLKIKFKAVLRNIKSKLDVKLCI